jgi:hypothetical protein
MKGTIIGHPIMPHLRNKNVLSMKDAKGKMFGNDFLAIAKSPKGHGWSEYYWPKPGAKEPTLKVSYILKCRAKTCLLEPGSPTCPRMKSLSRPAIKSSAWGRGRRSFMTGALFSGGRLMRKLTVRGRIWLLLALSIIPVVALGIINHCTSSSLESLMQTGDSTNGIIKGILLIHNHEKAFVEKMEPAEADRVKQAITTVEKQVAQADSGDHLQALEGLKTELAAYSRVFSEMADKTLQLHKQMENQRDLSTKTTDLIRKDIIAKIEIEQAQYTYTGVEVSINKVTLLGITRNLTELSERLQLNIADLMLFQNLGNFHAQEKNIKKEFKENLDNFSPLMGVIQDQEITQLKDTVPAGIKSQLQASVLVGTLWQQREQLRTQLAADGQSLVNEGEKLLATSESARDKAHTGPT